MIKHLLKTTLLSCSLLFGTAALIKAQTVDITERGGFLTTSFGPGSTVSERAGSLIDNNPATKMYNGNITAGTTYIQFKAMQPEIVTGYTITSANDSPDRDLSGWDFQGSTDGSNWVSLDKQSGQTFPARFQKNSYSFTNTNQYQYYRWYAITRQGGGTGSIQLAEIELLAASSTGKVNIMAVGGTTTDIWNTTGNEGAAMCTDSYIWKPSADNNTSALDGGTKYFTDHGTTEIVFAGNVKTIAQQYTLTSGNDYADRDPKTWKVLASNDTAAGWVTLDSQTGQAFNYRCETKTYPIAGNTTLYKFYKLKVTANNGASGFQLTEWQLQGQMGEIPAAPTSLTAASASVSSINLTWNDNSTIEDSYIIEQSWDQANWYRAITVPANTKNYTVTGLASNVKYYFRVRALRTDVGYSTYSNIVSAQPAKGGPTYVDITEYPGILSEKNNSDGSEGRYCAIDNNLNTKYSGAAVTWLQWKAEYPAAVDKYTITSANDDPTSDPKTWILQASNDGTNWVDLDKRTGETFASRFLLKTYTLTNSTKYTYYRLNFTANNGSSNRTQMTEIELYGTSDGIGGLSAPDNLVAVGLSKTTNFVTWSDNSFSEESYKIERSADSTNWSTVATVQLNTTSYYDSTVASNTKYYYRVAAYSTTYGLSAYSNVMSCKSLVGGDGLINLMALKGAVTAQYAGNSGEGVANLIDGNVNTKYNLSLAVTPPLWIEYDLPITGNTTKAAAVMYSVTSAIDPGGDGRDPVSWILQGSNDSVWTNLHTVTGEKFIARPQTKEYTFTNTKAFSKYRLSITGAVSPAPAYVQLAEWTVYADPGTSTPVELASFTAAGTRTGAELIWKTATELQNLGFDVERSVAKTNKWVKIGFVAGNGTTTKLNNYKFSDTKVSAGKYEYRLKQIDNNGTFKYSNNVEVEVGSVPKQFSLSQNYPNPFNPTTNLDFTVATNGRTTLKVYNVLGAEVTTLFDGQAEAGKVYQVSFNASMLSSGVYFARIESGNQHISRKLVLMK